MSPLYKHLNKWDDTMKNMQTKWKDLKGAFPINVTNHQWNAAAVCAAWLTALSLPAVGLKPVVLLIHSNIPENKEKETPSLNLTLIRMSNTRSKLLLVQHTDVLTKTIYRSSSSFFSVIHDIVIKIFSSPHPLTERTTACSTAQTQKT